MTMVTKALHGLRLGPALTVNNLVMTPLLRQRVRLPAYRTLDRALARGKFQVAEVSEAGVVSQVKVQNLGRRPVLLVDGEELVGAKQNRVLNTSVLVGGKSEVVVPVTCVEAGRWQTGAGTFGVSPRIQYAGLRARRNAEVADSLRTGGRWEADQSATWLDIAEKSRRMAAASPTRAMAAIYEQHAEGVESYVAACRPLIGQVGMVVTINGTVRGMDLFDTSATFAALLPKLMRGYALDALDTAADGDAAEAAGGSAVAFLKAVASAPGGAYPAVGLGQEVRLAGGGVTGTALVLKGWVVHVCAFPAADPSSRQTGVARTGMRSGAVVRRGRHSP